MTASQPYKLYDERVDASGAQKKRLCAYAVEQIINQLGLAHIRNPCTFLIGPGSTAAAFFEQFVARLRDRRLTVVTNNLAVVETLRKSEDSWDCIRCLICGTEVDFENRSLKVLDGGSMAAIRRVAKPEFSVISCGAAWRDGDEFCVGAFTDSHRAVLEDIVNRAKEPVYLIADDSKRELGLRVRNDAEREKWASKLNLFARLPRDARALSLIIEADAHPTLYAGKTEISGGLCTWWNKPQPRCFLSYGVKCYENRATQLHVDLRSQGIKCWKWDKDCPGGQHLTKEIDKALPDHLPVLLVCGEHSLKRPAVQHEIWLAYQHRHGSIKPSCIPILVDDYLFKWRPGNELRPVAEWLRVTKGVDGYQRRKPESYRDCMNEVADNVRSAWATRQQAVTV